MVRKDKKNRICECCGKTLATPQKLHQHYSSTKNQCSLPSENNNNQRRVNSPKVTRPIRPKSPRSRSPSPVPAPVAHAKGKDRRREKPHVVTSTPTSEPEPIPKSSQIQPPNMVERQDAHRQDAQEEPQMVTPTTVHKPEPQQQNTQDYITEEEAKSWVDPNARKPRESLKSWGARLQKRWKELDLGDDRDKPMWLALVLLPGPTVFPAHERCEHLGSQFSSPYDEVFVPEESYFV